MSHKHSLKSWERVGEDLDQWMAVCRKAHCRNCNAECGYTAIRNTRPNPRHKHVFRRPRYGLAARARKERGIDMGRCRCGDVKRFDKAR